MRHPVIAIELDAGDPILIESWIAQGHLKNLHQLQNSGAYQRLSNIDYYTTETKCTTFLTGCKPEKTGYWGPLSFQKDAYDVVQGNAYDFTEYSPFYALGKDYQVAVFDVPQSTLYEQVNGIQVLAWGAHAPYNSSQSNPPELLSELIQKHGKHPTLNRDSVDNWWDQSALDKFHRLLKIGIERRSKICQDLLKRQDWSLFLTGFSETHSAGHHFCHLSQPTHPLYQNQQHNDGAIDPLLDIYQSIDQALGEILASAPKDAYILIFSTHGTANNSTDLPSVLFLPELLYRFSFPEKIGFAAGRLTDPVPPLISNPKRRTWAGQVWQSRYSRNPIYQLLKRHLPGQFQNQVDRLTNLSKQPTLVSPYQLQQQSKLYFWQPTMWYQPLWHQMRAFALPSFGGEGFIRVNLQGRERNGVVPASDYNAICNELTDLLFSLKDAREGKPIVEKVIRTRQTANEDGSKLPDADLVVVWKDHPTDIVDSPKLGRIGPVPYERTGGHRPRGFVLIAGPDITSSDRLPEAHALDLAPTILKLMGAPIPKYCQGKPLL